MIYGFYIWSAFRNTARRDAVRDNVAQQFSQYALYEPASVADMNLRGNPDPGFVAQALFVDQADRDSTWAQLLAFMGTGVNGPSGGTTAYIWDSTKDEGTNNDVVTDRRTW